MMLTVVNAGAFENFAVMIGGASAALTGLLFVSVSLNRDLITRSAALRASAAQTLVLLVIPLVVCALLLVPDQHSWSLGVELIVTAVVFAIVLIRVQHHPGREEQQSAIAELVDRRETSLLTTVFVLVAAITHWTGSGGGLYWLVPAILLSVIAGVLNAWFFLLGDTG